MSSHISTLTFQGSGTNGKSAPKPKRPTTHTYRGGRFMAHFAPQQPGKFKMPSGSIYERLFSGQIIKLWSPE